MFKNKRLTLNLHSQCIACNNKNHVQTVHSDIELKTLHDRNRLFVVNSTNSVCEKHVLTALKTSL